MAIESIVDTLPPHTDRKPVVAIVGAGIAGLTLAILLEQQGIDYNVFERAKEVKPLGSAMSVGPAVIPLFKQLGIYDEFVSVAKVFTTIQEFTDKRESDYVMDIRIGSEVTGWDTYIISRPVLHELLQSRVPSHRIHMDTKVLSMFQNQKSVMIQTLDGQSYEADILIGADGAHSVVRQGLYASLKAEGRLPSSDDVALPFSCLCLVGQTAPSDPEQFPDLALNESQFINIHGDGIPYSWTTITTKQNTVCWAVLQFLDRESSKSDEAMRNSEWGPEAAEAMCKEVRDLAIPGAAPGAKPMILADLIDVTPPHLISKVMLEEKVFDTWYGGRTCLMGDACHKINPAGGQGALLAFHDAICLANWISILPSTEVESIENIFEEYKKERHPRAQAAYDSSQMFRNMAGKNLISKITRFISKRMPDWLWKMVVVGVLRHRPQVSFLPLIQDVGTAKPVYQASLQKTLQIRKERALVAV